MHQAVLLGAIPCTSHRKRKDRNGGPPSWTQLPFTESERIQARLIRITINSVFADEDPVVRSAKYFESIFSSLESAHGITYGISDYRKDHIGCSLL